MILVIGAAIVDKVMRIDHLPRSGDDILCTEARTVVGGCAFNVAATLRNLHVPHDLCVPIGTGHHADIIEKALRANGYPVLMRDTERDNGYCITLVEAGGERTFITVEGAECHFQPRWLEPIDLCRYDMVYLAGYQAVGESGRVLAQWLRKNLPQEAHFFFAPGPVITELDEALLAQVFSLRPVVHLNEKEILAYTGRRSLEEAMRALAARTENTVITTLGAAGAALFHEGKLTHIPAVETAVVDTTGAGDSHIGAVMGCLAQGDTWKTAVTKANKVAAILVGTSGPTVDEETFKESLINSPTHLRASALSSRR